ncbi:hypothetical protein LTR53_018344, partial [Teratosphaeriaceae sp. CCFEE 6253]
SQSGPRQARDKPSERLRSGAAQLKLVGSLPFRSHPVDPRSVAATSAGPQAMRIVCFTGTQHGRTAAAGLRVVEPGEGSSEQSRAVGGGFIFGPLSISMPVEIGREVCWHGYTSNAVEVESCA